MILGRKVRNMDSKAEQKTQEPGFVTEGSGETFNREKNNENAPAVPTG